MTNPHLIDGEFQSDKYPTTPRGKVPLSCKDKSAQDLLWEYAQRRRAIDPEFSDGLEQALRLQGYDPVTAPEYLAPQPPLVRYSGTPDRAQSVQPTWCRGLPVQQQSVLLLAARGPDGIAKAHPAKTVHVAYRACTLVAAKYGRELRWGEAADSFMSMAVIADDGAWRDATDAFFQYVDELPHHYLLHLAHGAEILGNKHPDARVSKRWWDFYLRFCEDMHMTAETWREMDARLSDWGRAHWEAR